MESEERFKALFEAAGDAIFLMDGDTFVACNQKTLDIFMCPRERIIGNQPYVLSPAFQPDGQPSKEKARRYVDAALAGELQRFPWRHLRCDGTEFDAEVTLTRVQLEGKYYLQAIVRDKTAEIALQREQERLIAIIEHTPEYIGTTTPDGKVVYLNDAFKRILPERFHEQLGKPGAVPFTAFHPPETGRMLSKTAIPYAVKHGMWQGESALLDSRGKPFAVLQTIVAHLDAAGRLEFISTICRDIEAYKIAQQKVETSERRFRALVENSDDAVIVLSPEGKRLYVSPNIERLTGRTWEEAMALPNPLMHLHPDDRQRGQEMLRKVAAQPGTIERGTFRIQHKDGHYFWASGTAQNRLTVPGIDGIVVNMRDVTAEHDADEKLRHAFDLLMRAERAARLGTYEYDVAHNRWTSTPQLDDIFGITKEYPHTADGWAEIVHPDERDAMRRYFAEEVMGRRQRFDREYRIKRPSDGTVRWVHGYGDLEFDAAGKPVRMVGTISDITDTHDTDTQLRTAEERFRLAAEQTGHLIYDWNIRDNVQTWDGAIPQLTGYSREEFRNLSNAAWAEMIHPDDREKALRLLDEARATGTRYHAEYRYRRKDGSYLLMEDTGAFLRDADGKVYRMVGAMRDVTEIREAAKARERQVAMFREVIDNALDAITIVGPDGNYRYQNRTAWEISGYSPDDPGEVNAFQHIHPEDLESVRGIFTKGLQTGEPMSATFRYRKKDGSWQWLEVSGISMLSNPLVQGVILFSRDITEQRTAQTRAKEARDRMDAIINAIGDPVFVKDTEHRWTLVNDAFCRFVGKSREMLVGKSDYDVFSAPQADAAWTKDTEVLASGTEISLEETLNDAKGVPRYFFTKKTIYTDPTGAKFIVGVMRDISVLRKARETEARAEELERLNKVMVGRELRMIELKTENERLAKELEKLRGSAG